MSKRACTETPGVSVYAYLRDSGRKVYIAIVVNFSPLHVNILEIYIGMRTTCHRVSWHFL